MRGKKAKAIRRAIYGDGSRRSGRDKIFIDKNTGQIVASDSRKAYQLAKKEARKKGPIEVERVPSKEGIKLKLKRLVSKGRRAK
jgi:hypothetical protein